MIKGRITVWLLELVTSPDRAAAIIGDLTEESTGRNRFWFWLQAAGIFCASARCEFAASPKRILLSFIATPFIFFLTNIAYISAETHFVIRFPEAHIFVPTVIFQILTYLLLGRTVAYISGTTIAGPVLCALPFALYSAAFELFYGFHHPALTFLTAYLGVAALFLPGTIWQRRRSLKYA